MTQSARSEDDQPTELETLLAYQKTQTFAGTVTHERDGLGIEETSGFVCMSSNFVFIFADNNTLIRDQKRVMVPYHRLIKIEGDE